VKLAFSSDDRLAPPGGEDSRSALGGALIYGLLLPFTVAAVALGGWYMVTGETPLDLVDRLSHGPRIALPMPARPGAEKPDDALIQPPAATPAPQEKSAEKSPDKPAGPPQISLPVTAPPPPDKPAAPEAKTAAQDAPAKEAVKPSSGFVAPPPPPALAEPAIPPGGESLAPPSFTQLPALKEAGKPLPPAPLPDLLRQTGAGSLPIRAGGKEAWRAYSRPIAGAQTKPGAKIAVVVTSLGLSTDGTMAAIAKLPPDVSLSFSPYGASLADQIRKARENGHEVLLDLPLEPVNFPAQDPGPMAVLQSHSPGEAIARLDGVLGRANSYVGVSAALRSPVTATESWPLMLQELKDRGLLFVGDGLVGVDDKALPAAGLVTLVADETPFRTAIDAKLARALATAQRDGGAIVTLSARPISFERLLAFIASFPEKNVTLVPVSALVRPEP
jgi:polysaccharide deacetylase 2 family uncharacterized protein YibQ